MHRPLALLTLVVTATMASAAAPDASDAWSFLPPKRRLMAPLLADPHEALSVVTYGHSHHGPNLFDVKFGANLVMLRWDGSDGDALDISVRGLVASRFATNRESFPLLSVDYFGGAAVGYRKGGNTFELYGFHQSSHLGDESLDFHHRERIDFSREAVRLLWSREFGDLRLYAGPSVTVNASPDCLQGRVTLQAGGEYAFRLGTHHFYAAADVQSLQANDWNLNLSAQVGWFLGAPQNHPNEPRLFLAAFTGHSPYGQFLNETESTFTVGFGFRL